MAGKEKKSRRIVEVLLNWEVVREPPGWFLYIIKCLGKKGKNDKFIVPQSGAIPEQTCAILGLYY